MQQVSTAGKNEDHRGTGHVRNGRVAAMWAAVVLLLAFCPGAPPALAQAPNSGGPSLEAPKRLTLPAVQTRLKALDEQKDLGEEALTKIRGLYDESIQYLERENKSLAEGAEFEKSARNASAELAAAKARSEAPPAAPEPLPANASLSDLRQLLPERMAARDAARAEVKRLDGEPSRRQKRRTEIPEELQQAKELLAGVEAQLAAPAPAEEAAPVTAARRARFQAERQFLAQRLATLQSEQAAYAATADLLPTLRDLAARDAARAEEAVAAVERQLEQQRQQEAKNNARQARMDAARAMPELQTLATRNQAYAERNAMLPSRIEDVTRELTSAEERLRDLRSEVQRTEEKVERVGLTDAIGLMLRKQRSSLPNVGQLERRIDERQEEDQALRLELMDLDDARLELADLQAAVDRAMENINLANSEHSAAELEHAVREVLQKQKDQLDALIRNLNSYFERRVELDSVEQALMEVSSAYSDYVDEHVLWIRSAPRLSLNDVWMTGEVAVQLFSPALWSSAVAAIAKDFQQYPLLWVAFLGVWGLVLVRQRRWHKEISLIAETAIKRSCCRMTPTWRALWLTMLGALPAPGLMLFVGARLLAATDGEIFPYALGWGFISGAALLLPAECLRQVCVRGGLAAAHFDWPDSTRRYLRRQLRWLVLSVPLLLLVAATVGRMGNEAYSNSMARLTFIAAVALIAWFAHRVLLPSGPIFRNLAAIQHEGWTYRLRYVWYVAGVAGLLLLAALPAFGYYYTAYQLSVRLMLTLWFLLGLLFLTSLLLRWLLLHRRAMAMEEARERRAAMAAAASAALEETTMTKPALVEDVGPNLATISEQTKQLLNVLLFVIGVVGIWLIWVDVLPALGVLNKIELWRITQDEKSVAVTLGHIVLSALIFSMTFLAVKNIPGLLELLILQRLPLDAGARFAVTTIFRYVLTIVGVIWAFNMIGIEWAKYQWLVAAATVGLGFGLQEIFANFVAGLIVLFERPARVGDVITVQGVTGVVSRIRTRATTVTNWDRQEFIVPNKEFVTGNVTNWTLSNRINRVETRVGVAYGADADVVTELLKKIVNSLPQVLKDPPPQVIFDNFGDTRLNFVVRCYLPDLDVRLLTIHELNSAVHREFNKAGIEIAFPQRDIRLRSVDAAIPVELRSAFPSGDKEKGARATRES